MGEPSERSTLFTEPLPADPLYPISPKIARGAEDALDRSISSYEPGWTPYLVVAGVATTIGSSIPVGYNIGVVNTPAELLKAFCNDSIVSHYDVVLSERWLEVVWSSVVSVFIVGGCAGSMLGASLANSVGRKGGTIVTNLLSIVGAVLFLFCRQANSVEMLFAGRLLVGLAAGLTTSIVPMYLTELAPARLTGAIGVVCPLGVNFGVLIAQVLALNFILGGEGSWHYLLAVFGLLSLVSLFILFFLPESPKYLYAVARDEDKALKELTRIRGVNSILLGAEVSLLQREADGAGAGADRRNAGVGGVWQRRYLLPALLACSMQAGQQLSGINAVFFYSKTIFMSADLSESSAEYATIGCGLVNCCTAVLMVWLLPRAGRRPLLLGSTLAAACLLASLPIWMHYLHVPGIPYVCMLVVLGYVFAYGFGLGPIPYFIASELFEVSARGWGMALGSLANWGGNLLVAMLFPLMRYSLHSYSFLVFASITMLLFLFLRQYFPETQGKTPLEVATLLQDGFRSRPLRPVDTPCPIA